VSHARPADLADQGAPWDLRVILIGVVVVAAALAASVYAEAKGGPFVLVALAAVAVGVAALRSPAWATGLLVVVVFTRIFAYEGSDRIAPGGLALVLGLAALATQRVRSRPDAMLPFIGVAGLYTAIGVLSALWAFSPPSAFDASRVLIFQVLVAVGVIACVGGLRELRWATWGLIGAGTVIGLLALRQYYTHDYSSDILGLTRASVEQIVGQKTADRAGGPVGDANFFGQMMVVIVVLALARARAEPLRAVRLIAAACAAIAAFTVVITYSRGGFIAMVVGAVLALIQSRHRMRALVIAACALVVGTAVLPHDYTERLGELTTVASQGSSAGGTSDPAIKGRTSSWIVASHMIAHDPIVGVGYGNFSDEYLSYSRSVGLDTRGQQRNAHSFPLQVLAEQGVVGAGALLLVVGGAFASMSAARRRLIRGGGSDDEITLISGIRDALIVYLTASIFLHNAYPQLFWLLLGLAWATHQCVALPRRTTAGAAGSAP
jgi:O-antigen ligase